MYLEVCLLKERLVAHSAWMGHFEALFATEVFEPHAQMYAIKHTSRLHQVCIVNNKKVNSIC